MLSMLLVGSLSGCAWLMENPEELPPRRAVSRVEAPVSRSNQGGAAPVDATMRRGTLSKDVISSGSIDERTGKRRYNPVVTPIVTEGAPVEFKTSTGVKIIRPNTRAKDGGWRERMQKAESAEQRAEIDLERRTAAEDGFR